MWRLISSRCLRVVGFMERFFFYSLEFYCMAKWEILEVFWGKSRVHKCGWCEASTLDKSFR